MTVENSGGGGGGGGATYTGINGGAYGVFVGGGYGGTTDVDACVWTATSPSNRNSLIRSAIPPSHANTE